MERVRSDSVRTMADPLDSVVVLLQTEFVQYGHQFSPNAVLRKWSAVLSLKHAPSGSTIQMLVQYFGQSGFDVDGSISASWHTSLLNQSPRSASLETLLV